MEKNKHTLKSQKLIDKLADAYVRKIIVDKALYKLKKQEPNLTRAMLRPRLNITKDMIAEERAKLLKIRQLRENNLKICTVCKEAKDRSHFRIYKNQIHRGCKDCEKHILRQHKAIHRDKYLAKDRERTVRDIKELKNWYILRLIKQNMYRVHGLKLKSADISKDLIELIRKKIVNQRQITYE